MGYLGVGVHTSYLMENYRSTSNIETRLKGRPSSGKSSSRTKLRQNMKPREGAGATPRIIAYRMKRQEGRQLVPLRRS
jgi:hypothetical protein